MINRIDIVIILVAVLDKHTDFQANGTVVTELLCFSLIELISSYKMPPIAIKENVRNVKHCSKSPNVSNHADHQIFLETTNEKRDYHVRKIVISTSSVMATRHDW